nr:hypothetical protein [Pelodictyon luteolum]
MPDPRFRNPFFFKHTRGIARHEENPHGRTEVAQFQIQFTTIHPRHDNIGKEQIWTAGTILKGRPRR